MRPDEWARTSARRFNATVQMLMTYEKGMKEVKDEQGGWEDTIVRLKKRAGMGQVGL